MKTLHAFLLMTLVTAGFQTQVRAEMQTNDDLRKLFQSLPKKAAPRFTKGQKVYPGLDRYGGWTPRPDLARAFEVLECDAESVVVFRKDTGKVRVRQDLVFVEKSDVQWFGGEPIDSSYHLAISAGSTIINQETDSSGKTQLVERKVKRVFETPVSGRIALALENGSIAVTKEFWVLDHPTKGSQSVDSRYGEVRIGDVATTASAYENWAQNSNHPLTLPVAKINAIAWDAGGEPLLRLGKNTWLKSDDALVSVKSAYNVKVGDRVYLPYKDFSQRVTQIFRVETDWQQSKYTALLTDGGAAYLNRKNIEELLSYKVCIGDEQSTDWICEAYREDMKAH